MLFPHLGYFVSLLVWGPMKTLVLFRLVHLPELSAQNIPFPVRPVQSPFKLTAEQSLNHQPLFCCFAQWVLLSSLSTSGAEKDAPSRSSRFPYCASSFSFTIVSRPRNAFGSVVTSLKPLNPSVLRYYLDTS